MAIGARFRRATNIREGESGSIALVAAVFLILEAGRSLGEIGATTLVWGQVARADVPWLYIPLGLVSMGVAIAFGTALGRVERGRLFAGVLVIAAVLLGVGWLSLGVDASLVPIIWLAVMAIGALSLTLTWAVATSTLDARQAKRLFPLCTAAAILGSLAGSLAAGPVSSLVGTSTLIAVEGVAFGLAALVVARLARRGVGSGWRPVVGPARPMSQEVRSGFDEVRRSPLLRLVAVAYVLLAVLLFFVTYPYQSAAKSAFPDDVALAGAFGTISAIVTGASFLVSVLLADRFYRRFGVAAAALALPLVYLVGFGVWLISFSFVSAAAVMILLQVTQRGLSNAAWSAFYNVVPAPRRAQALAFNDGVPGQIGMVLSGVLLLAVTGLLAPTQVFLVGLLTAALCTVIVIGIRRRYGDALVRSLRRGAGEQVLEGGPGFSDRIDAPDVRRALLTALRDQEPTTRQLAAQLLGRMSGSDVAAALRVALDDPSASVRGEAVVALLDAHDRRGPGAGPASDDAEATLVRMIDGDPGSRLAGLRAMVRLARPLEPGRRAVAVRDPDPTIRAAAMTLLAGAVDAEATTMLRAALDDGAHVVARSAAAALAKRPAPDPMVLERLGSVDVADQVTCLLALEGHGPTVRVPVLALVERQVARALMLQEARRVILSGLGGPPDARARWSFLTDVLSRRIEATQDLALTAMSTLGAPAAGGVIRRCLRSTDADVRAQAVEAIDSIGDRRLGALLTALLEAPTASTDAVGFDTVVDRLRDDDDPWIRSAARRTTIGLETMDDEDRTLGEIETMLRLRRVPLFARLAPEDLQRIAAVAVQRDFEEGAILIREGDVGDALFVLIDGRVRVIHHDADGVEHQIRTYEAGDHIGELAILRERPRAATVIADGGSVRVLALEGEAVMAILRERPDAAMAMLATLAERISAQA